MNRPNKPQFPRMQLRTLAAISPLDTTAGHHSPISPSGRARTAAVTVASIQNLIPPTEVIPRLYISDLAAVENAAMVAQCGITHVVSVMRGAVALPAPLMWLQVPVSDNPFAELVEHLPRAVAFIAGALQDPRARVLVHCVQGVSRSASVVAAFLIKECGYAPAQAVQYVKGRRPGSEPNAGFVTQLGEYSNMVRAGAAVAGQRR